MDVHKKSGNEPLYTASGQLKYAGSFHARYMVWKSGELRVYKTPEGSHVIEVAFSCDSNTKKYKIEAIEKVTAKSSRLVINFKKDETLHGTFEGKTLQAGQYIQQLFNDANTRSGNPITTIFSTKSLASPGRFISPPSNKAYAQHAPLSGSKERKPLDDSNLTSVNARILSPFTAVTPSKDEQKFTGMKEKKHEVKLFSEFGDRTPRRFGAISDEDDNDENLFIKSSNPYSKASDQTFLNKGQEKSKQTLTQKTFYSSTPTASYGGFGFSTGVTEKRKPGLLPCYPMKRPRMNEAVYSWRPNQLGKPKTLNQTTLQGFSNLGNTCYMNAILQALYSLDTFRTDLSCARRRVQTVWSQDSLAYALSRLFMVQGMSLTGKPELQDKKRESLRAVKRAISSTAKRFSGNEQHDAHEFLSQILDQLKEDINRLNMTTPISNRLTEETIDLTSAVPAQANVNPISSNFEFEVLHSITCSQCGEIVTKEETFHDLAIEVPRRSKIHLKRSLQDSLNFFFGKEKLEYKCEECGGTESVVTHHFTKLPRVLILHLKRYQYMSAAQKVACPVFIPKFLTLQLCCNEETQPAQPPSAEKENYPSPVKRVNQDQLRRKLEDSYSPEKRRLFNFKTPFKRIKESESSDEEYRLNQALAKSIKTNKEEDPDFWKVLEMSKTDTAASDEDDQLAKAIRLSMQEATPVGKTSNVVADEEEQIRKALELSLQDAPVVEDFEEMDKSDDDTTFTNIEDKEDHVQLLQMVADNAETGVMPYSYSLVSVVSHFGSSSAGHYVSDVYDRKKKSWSKCDDSRVEKTDEKTVREGREKTGYIFFYLSKDVFGDLES